MPGKRQSNALAARLEQLAKANGDAGALEYVTGRVESGEHLVAIAAELQVTRSLLSRYVNGLPGGKAAIAAARVEGTHATLEGLEAELTDPNLSREQIAAIQQRLSLAQFRAKSLNRAEFGDVAPQVNVVVDNRGAFLDALRVRDMDTLRAGANYGVGAGLLELEAGSAIAGAIVEDATIVSDDDA